MDRKGNFASDIESIDSIVNRISALHASILCLDNNEFTSDFARHLHDELLRLFNGINDHDLITTLEKRFMACGVHDDLVRFNAEFHKFNEIKHAQEFLMKPHRPDIFEGSWINTGFFDTLTGQVGRWREIGILPRIVQRPIVIVGGGAIPQTQLYLHKVLAVDIVSIEVDEFAAELCRQVLKSTGNQNLSVFNMDGADFDYGEFGLVIVATLVRSKERISKRIGQTLPNALFAPRNPVRLHTLWRETVDRKQLASDGWQLIDDWSPLGASISSLCFERDY